MGQIALLQKINYVNLAIKVADQLEKSAVYHWDYITWLKQGKPLGYHLYDGCSGIALFFAALYNETGKSKYRKIALKVIQPLHPASHAYYKHTTIKENAISIAIGYPSYMYSLILIGQFLREDFNEYIYYYLSFITRDAIVADQTLDVMHGSAGTILALLKVHKLTKNNTALKLAMIAGEHLSDKSVSLLRMGHPLTGFAHGAAGISYALIKLYENTNEKQFKEMAQAWLEYERAVYSKEHRNWPDLRHKHPSYLNSWCHGATGIGLARLGSLSKESDEKIVAEIDNVLALNLADAFMDANHLCCGNFGRIEFLISYAEKLYQTNRKYEHQYVQKLLDETNVEAKLSHYLQNPALSKGFFLGIAGIGYQFLRLHSPNHYPSILLFE